MSPATSAPGIGRRAARSGASARRRGLPWTTTAVEANSRDAKNAVVNPKPIDLWDAGTFDPELTALLRDNADLVRSYVETERRIFLTHDHGPGRASLDPRPENPHARAHLVLQEDVAADMRLRTIRAYHYTRLTDSEVGAMRRDGIHLSTPATLRDRLKACVAEGLLTPSQADALHAASPFHGQADVRADRFWATSHPHAVDHSGVSPLLQHWGGEAANMWVEDGALIAKVQAIGKPRIVEVGVPLGLTTAGWSAADAVLATFARSLGCVTAKHAIDVCVTAALPPDAILAVHTDGEETFTAMGRGYPAGFVDVGLTYWKDLTGEDD